MTKTNRLGEGYLTKENIDGDSSGRKNLEYLGLIDEYMFYLDKEKRKIKIYVASYHPQDLVFDKP